MGGVSVLLMIAAMGITYGWQPDDGGGVEYIIQIPPDQLDEIERVGEITSLIDPAVRGHVSRVIVRVGNGPLPRRTSANFARARNPQSDRAVVAASDQSPVPIPEMGDGRGATPIPSMDPAAMLKDAPAAVMKPDVNDPSGPGFSFPAIPSTLRDTATAAGNTRQASSADATSAQASGAQAFGAQSFGAQASRSQIPGAQASGTQGTGVFSGGALSGSRLGANNRVQPQAPRFTGSDPTGELARTRQGGPTTDPAGRRDNTWQGFATNPTSGPSTDPVGSNVAPNSRFDPRVLNAQDRAAADALSKRRGASGLSPNDTFGKLPGGLSLPATVNQPAVGGASGNLFTRANVNRDSNAQAGNSQTGIYSQYEQTQLDLQRRNASSVYGQPQYDSVNRDQMPAGNNGPANASARGSSHAQTETGGINNLSPVFGTRGEQAPQTRMEPDSRLTRQQVDAGAWSVDIYNRPIDRDGRLVQTTNKTTGVYGTDPRQQADRYADRTYSTLGQPNMSQPMVNQPRMAETSTSNQQTQPRSGSHGNNASLPANTRPANDNQNVQSVRNDFNRRPRSANDVQLDPPSLSNRSTTSALQGSVSSGATQGSRHVAAQPLFNGLLLISFVANIYLIFWLKNLRLQFRDLVAAKRIGNSNSQTA